MKDSVVFSLFYLKFMISRLGALPYTLLSLIGPLLETQNSIGVKLTAV